MIDLQKISGLPIALQDDLRIKFNSPMDDREPTYIREFSKVAMVLKDPNIISPAEWTYLGYRELYLPEHSDLVKSHHLQYDLTIVPPLMLGTEFNKTIGHYHANIPGSKIAHPELYQILHGQGLFLLQKMDHEFKRVLDVIAVVAKAGDQIIYPPNYGHNFINIGPEILVTANWLSTDYKPLYEPVAAKHGMAYYVVKTEGNQFDLVANQTYQDTPKPRFVNPIIEHDSMYTTGMANPASLDFLNNPEKYASMFI